jgi:hypothetical protein
LLDDVIDEFTDESLDDVIDELNDEPIVDVADESVDDVELTDEEFIELFDDDDDIELLFAGVVVSVDADGFTNVQ